MNIDTKAMTYEVKAPQSESDWPPHCQSTEDEDENDDRRPDAWNLLDEESDHAMQMLGAIIAMACAAGVLAIVFWVVLA